MFVLRVDDDISLRLHDTYNVEGFYNLIDHNREHLRQWMNWEKNYREVDDVHNYFMWERRQFAEGNAIPTVIYYRGEVAGSCGLIIHNKTHGFGEIGYWIGTSFTGKGIVTRATKALANYAFNTLNMHKVILKIIVGNDKSIAVADRLGFKFEGIQVKERFLRGEYYDYSVHYLLAEEWQDKTTPEFAFQIDEKTELRPFMPHHAQEVFALVNQHRNTLRQWMDWVDGHQTLRDSTSFIKTALEHYSDYDGLDTGIWYDGQFCGQVSFNSWSLRNFKADLGYWLADSYTGKGIMTKAVRAMLDYAFGVVGMHRVELLCAVQNERSCAVAKRLNFTHEGVLRRGERIRNQFYDVNAYAKLKPDWKTE